MVISGSFSKSSAVAQPSVNEIDLDDAQTTLTSNESSTLGPREIKMARYANKSGFTRALTFEGVLQSSTSSVTSEAKLWDVTDDVMITGSLVDNSGAPDASLPTAFFVSVTAGTTSGTIRTDVDHLYELRVSRVGGSPTDLAKANARLVIKYT